MDQIILFKQTHYITSYFVNKICPLQVEAISANEIVFLHIIFIFFYIINQYKIRHC